MILLYLNLISYFLLLLILGGTNIKNSVRIAAGWLSGSYLQSIGHGGGIVHDEIVGVRNF